MSAPAVYRLNGSLPRWAAKISKRLVDAAQSKDPFYLYINNGKELKLQRLNLGKDATALAINWAAQNKTAEFEKASSSHVLPPTAEARLVFIRHRMEGTASSPNIRASEVFFPRDEDGPTTPILVCKLISGLVQTASTSFIAP